MVQISVYRSVHALVGDGFNCGMIATGNHCNSGSAARRTTSTSRAVQFYEFALDLGEYEMFLCRREQAPALLCSNYGLDRTININLTNP